MKIKKILMVGLPILAVAGTGLYFWRKRQGGEVEEEVVEPSAPKGVKLPTTWTHGQKTRKDKMVYVSIAPADKSKVAIGKTMAIYGGKYDGQKGKITKITTWNKLPLVGTPVSSSVPLLMSSSSKDAKTPGYIIVS